MNEDRLTQEDIDRGAPYEIVLLPRSGEGDPVHVLYVLGKSEEIIADLEKTARRTTAAYYGDTPGGLAACRTQRPTSSPAKIQSETAAPPPRTQ